MTEASRLSSPIELYEILYILLTSADGAGLQTKLSQNVWQLYRLLRLKCGQKDRLTEKQTV